MKYLFYFFHFYVLSACVSVQFQGTSSKAHKAEDIKYEDPQSSAFEKSDLKNSDASWVSKNTGSSISYFSSCSQNEPPLRNLRANSLQGIESVDIQSEETTQISNREGLLSTVDGKLEGVPITMELMIFKKNLCSFQISYVSLKKNFEKERSIFKRFLNNFKAP